MLLDLHKSFIMVGTFEREAFTKFITLFILRLPAKIQKNSLPPLAKSKSEAIFKVGQKLFEFWRPLLRHSLVCSSSSLSGTQCELLFL